MTKSYEYIYGFHAVEAILKAEAQLIEELYISAVRGDDRMQKIEELAKSQGIKIKFISREELKQLADSSVPHQGIIAKCSRFSSLDEHVLINIVEQATSPLLLLILDGVQDPHNLGACLRSANALGVQAVIAPKDRACGLTPVVRKVASGAASITPFIQVTNLGRTMRWLQQQGVWIVGTVLKTPDLLHQIDLSGSVAIAMGGEEKGLRQLTQKHCDYLAKIPMPGNVESLNVSVATAICLYEAMRQRL